LIKTDYGYKIQYIDVGAVGTERYKFEIQFIRLKPNNWYFKIIDLEENIIIFSSNGEIENNLKDVIFEAGITVWSKAIKYMNRWEQHSPIREKRDIKIKWNRIKRKIFG
jgi:hypothetical protein